MLITRFLHMYSMLGKRGWREVLVRFDQLLNANYFDFSAVNTEKAGLDPRRSHAHRGSALDVCHVLNQLPLLPQSSIIDVGCGKGRAMIAMARFPFNKIAGVEISAQLANVARRNLSRAFLRNRSQVITSCASVFDDYDGFNYFYFYNPFPIEVLREVIDHIHSSIRRRPRECWLIYNVLTSPEVEEIICKNDLFKRISDYQPPGRKLIVTYCHRPASRLVIPFERPTYQPKVSGERMASGILGFIRERTRLGGF